MRIATAEAFHRDLPRPDLRHAVRGDPVAHVDNLHSFSECPAPSGTIDAANGTIGAARPAKRAM